MTRLILSALATLSLGACQHNAEVIEAVVADDAPETIDALKAGLREAMGRNVIEFGATDPTQVSSVSVLPMPLSPRDDLSLERPTIFDLVLIDNVCFAINRETGQQTRLAGVPCRPL